ncbi:hypothetical protein AB0C40_26395 [Streptomyces brevispora]|uniref:Uncharacterized protein n=1 Tax=Streptomyces brevispora TaxID=887462 RepID=A0A561TXG0_9ACTN|nr:hypothetical protein [Streptomyces brevispora]TWF91790.1 hypothetical protein FHX80_12106 [Streptomyces brevispora]WSC17244.1 hypothetical protein OIE64_33440 [Streptomyces brevispora]
MGKKQSRHNRGARSGGHEHSSAAEPKEQTSTAPTPAPEGVEAISEHVSHKRERKFGHN